MIFKSDLIVKLCTLIIFEIEESFIKGNVLKNGLKSLKLKSNLNQY